MDQRLNVAAKAGNVDTLYTLINGDKYILEHIDQLPFIDTPLHVAASEGHLDFAMEMMRLKPSYARKLNQDGYSPIHLALHNKKFQMVRRLLEFDRGLVRIQGRQGKTPLHFAAEHELDGLLAEESALHIAAKENKLEALKVLLGWLEHVGKDEVLKWTDDEGNTILHVAASRNQIEMVKLFINRADINAKNLEGSTALDIIEMGQRRFDCKELRLMLLRSGALNGSLLPHVPTLADSLKTKMSWHQKWIISDYRKNLYLSSENRNIILVVAVLFATANYQAVLEAPSSDKGARLSGIRSVIFASVNNIAFLASMVEIYFHLPRGCDSSLRIVLPLVIFNFALIHIGLDSIFIIAIFMVLFYWSKLVVLVHKFFPLRSYKKSLEVKCSLFKHCSNV
ncbi:hypothetical protein UlMin_034309 [Ulmus minor]